MADTTFTDGVTVIYSSWLQDINDAFYKSTGTAAKGGVLHGGTVGVGYGSGAGGTITQATSKSTGVTLSKLSGAITMNAASLGANTTVGFLVTNTLVAATDVPVVAIKSGATADAYELTVDAVNTGSFRINIRNQTGGALAEAVVINFVIFKGVSA